MPSASSPVVTAHRAGLVETTPARPVRSGWTFLDDPGRCVAKKCEFEGDLDVVGRVWTPRRVLQNRRLQVPFLSHLPEKSDFIWTAGPCLQANVCALTTMCPQSHTTRSTTVGSVCTLL